MDERDLLPDRGFVEKIPGREIVHAVKDKVGIPHQLIHILGNDLVRKCCYGDVGVQLLKRLLCGNRLVRADPVMVMEYLAVEVRLVGRVKIADADIADAGNSKIDRDRGTEPSGTGDKDR